MRCTECPYHWKEPQDRFPCCHYEGQEDMPPCEWEEYEEDFWGDYIPEGIEF